MALAGFECSAGFDRDSVEVDHRVFAEVEVGTSSCLNLLEQGNY